RRQHPDHAILLGERQRGETRPLGPDTREGRGLLGKAAQHAVVALGPTVVRTGEGTRAATPVGHLGAAMPAHVEKRAHPSIAAPQREDRNARQIIGPVGTGLRPVAGKPHHQGSLPDEHLFLPLVALERGIGAYLIAPRRIGHCRRLGVDAAQHTLQNRDLSRSVHASSSTKRRTPNSRTQRHPEPRSLAKSVGERLSLTGPRGAGCLSPSPCSGTVHLTKLQCRQRDRGFSIGRSTCCHRDAWCSEKWTRWSSASRPPRL